MAQAPWYTFPRIDNMGSPDPYGGFPKPDSNIQLPANYPVTALLPGTVTSTDGGGVSWGGTVTIRLDTPLNSLATHTSYIHLAGETVSTGQHVSAGQLIGYNGGSAAQGAQKVPLGFALYNGDHYGFDGWQYETYTNVTGLLNPVSLLNAAKNGTLPVPGGGGSGGTVPGSPVSYNPVSLFAGLLSASPLGPVPTYTDLLQQVHSTLIAMPGFYGMALAIDEAEQFPGWIDLTQPQTLDLAGVNTGISLPDIGGEIRSIGATVTDNFMPLMIRSGLVLMGSILLMSLVLKAAEPAISGAMKYAPLLMG
jgi:hypothetical protein